jgi:hypothetical protein
MWAQEWLQRWQPKSWKEVNIPPWMQWLLISQRNVTLSAVYARWIHFWIHVRIFGVASVHNWYCSWIIWSLITILWLSDFHFIFLQILYATIVQCYCFSICPVTPQPIERHELRQAHFFLCKMYIPSLTCWLPDMWVFSLSSISRFLWHWRRKALTRQIVTCEFVAFLCLQEEYVEGDELGKIDCGHGYHVSCIQQWLVQKNQCPICKATALS